MVITDDETALMERIVIEHGEIPEAQAILVVEIAKQQERLFGGTEDYLVTRQWVDGTSLEERLALLRCCFLVDAVDDSITRRGERRPQRDRQRAAARRRRRSPGSGPSSPIATRSSRRCARRPAEAAERRPRLGATDQARRSSTALGPSRRPTSASSSAS